MEDKVTPVEKVQSERRDTVAVITINNAPTGALSSLVRSQIAEHIALALVDDAVQAVVITGTDAIFATGAGVQEHASDAPSLADLCQTIEDMSKPVAVAINGAALGGGLELALAAHLRVAVPSARLGCPEITLGLVPNAGGTQRLPKVIGGVIALKLLLSGRSVRGDAAHKIGLVDAVGEGDVVAMAVAHVKSLSESG
ncbi:MAG: enoyl-CoA hydratase-related protein, partial [Paracoccaceae bacterium]